MEISLGPVRSVRQSGGGERPPGLVHETTLRGTGRALTQKDAGVRVDGRQSPTGGYISTYRGWETQAAGQKSTRVPAAG